MTVKITNRQNSAWHQYGEPVRTNYGHMVEVFESSAAEGPHCWLRLYDGGQCQVARSKGEDHMAHLTLEQAVAIRDRLTAFIDEAPTRWKNPA